MGIDYKKIADEAMTTLTPEQVADIRKAANDAMKIRHAAAFQNKLIEAEVQRRVEERMRIIRTTERVPSHIISTFEATLDALTVASEDLRLACSGHPDDVEQAAAGVEEPPISAADLTMTVYRYEGHVYLPLPRRLQVPLSSGQCGCEVCKFMLAMKSMEFAHDHSMGRTDLYYCAMDTLMIGPDRDLKGPSGNFNEGRYSYLCHHPALNPANQRYLPTAIVHNALRAMGYAI